jgi:hypothetical protein
MDSKYNTAFTINVKSGDDNDPELKQKGTFQSIQAIEVIKLVITKSVPT